MKIRKIIIAAMGVLLAGVGVDVNARMVSGILTPSLTITTGCTVSLTGVVAFPNTPIGVAVGTVITSVIGTVLVAGNCKKYWLGADAGGNYTSNVRHLAFGVNKIAYSVDLSGYGTLANWGTVGMPTTPARPTTGGQAAYRNNPASPHGSTDVYTITGNATIPTGIVAGNYTDTVNVIIEF